MSDPLLDPLFGAAPPLLPALVEVEAALARAAGRVGLIPAGAAADIVACCRNSRFDAVDLGRRAVGSASVVVPLVEEIRALVPATAAPYVHYGATSQDVIDTALSLNAARAIDAMQLDLDACAVALARLASAHRETEQIGRTLGQHAQVMTFGLTCAGWLAGLVEAWEALRRCRRERLAVQLGGPVGALAATGDQARALIAAFAEELALAAPAHSWHTNRVRVAELASGLGLVAGALGKIGQDVALLAQTEISEVAEGQPGTSSSMPHKRNPARSVLLVAAAHRAAGLVGAVYAGLPQELQRATGRWQAEWVTIGDLLGVCGVAAGHARVLLDGLRVDPRRMRANLDTFDTVGIP
jgi:3-carboxy-cis,cis-muconate cycloisomerase